MVKHLEVCEEPPVNAAPCHNEAKFFCTLCHLGLCGNHSQSHERITCPMIVPLIVDIYPLPNGGDPNPPNQAPSNPQRPSDPNEVNPFLGGRGNGDSEPNSQNEEPKDVN